VSESLIPDLLDALVAAWNADATLQTYGQRLRIFDGPPTTDRAAEIEIWVGATGLDADEEVVVFTQRRADFEGDRDETLSISHAVWVANGSHDIAAARRLAVAVYAAAAATVRTSTLSVAGVQAIDVSDGRLRQGEFDTGVGCVLTFTTTAICFL
jgi:hypothetical protein